MEKILSIFLRDVTLTWWQVSIFKLCVFCCGALFTIYLYNFFASIEQLLWVFAIIPGIYIMYIYFHPTKRAKFLRK